MQVFPLHNARSSRQATTACGPGWDGRQFLAISSRQFHLPRGASTLTARSQKYGGISLMRRPAILFHSFLRNQPPCFQAICWRPIHIDPCCLSSHSFVYMENKDLLKCWWKTAMLQKPWYMTVLLVIGKHVKSAYLKMVFSIVTENRWQASFARGNGEDRKLTCYKY